MPVDKWKNTRKSYLAKATTIMWNAVCGKYDVAKKSQQRARVPPEIVGSYSLYEGGKAALKTIALSVKS
jgi:hypothetical protein